MKLKQRENALRLPSNGYYDYIRTEVAKRLTDRLDDIRREEGFPLALEIGTFMHEAIDTQEALGDMMGGMGGVRKLVQLDETLGSERKAYQHCETYPLSADPEDKLPFPDGTFDLVTASLTLHWVNDLPGVFSEVSRVLKPDGCFLLAMVGGTTLEELRTSLVLAELERDGGVGGAHVGPFCELTDVGALMQRAGFQLPTLDTDTIRVSFPNAAMLMEHLQRMGENNASVRRRERTPLDTFLAASCIYDDQYGADGEVEASMRVIYAIGWTPHASQPQPLERGSATHKIGDVKVENTATDENEANQQR